MKYETMFMKVDSSMFNTAEANAVVALMDTSDRMHKWTNYS
jgi:hypothetical protein